MQSGTPSLAHVYGLQSMLSACGEMRGARLAIPCAHGRKPARWFCSGRAPAPALQPSHPSQSPAAPPAVAMLHAMVMAPPCQSVSSSDRHPQNLLSQFRHPIGIPKTFLVSFVIRSASPKPSCHALIPWSVSGNDAHDGAAVAGAGAVVGTSPPPTNRNNAPRPPRAASCAFVLVSCTACPMPETP